MGRTPGAKNKKTIESETVNPPLRINTNENEHLNAAGTHEPPEQKDKLNSIKEEFNNIKVDSEIKEESKKEKRSGYKSKKIREQEFQDSISGVGSFLLSMIVERLPNPRPLTSEESKNFDTMFSKVAFKYSALLGEYQEEAALVGITLMVIIPRLKSVEE